MIHQSLRQNSGSSRFRSRNGGVVLGVSCFEKFFGLLRHCFEMSELFLIELGADLHLFRIRFPAQAAQEAGFDHLGQVALCFEMQFLAEHACGFDILNTVEQNERLEW